MQAHTRKGRMRSDQGRIPWPALCTLYFSIKGNVLRALNSGRTDKHASGVSQLIQLSRSMFCQLLVDIGGKLLQQSKVLVDMVPVCAWKQRGQLGKGAPKRHAFSFERGRNKERNIGGRFGGSGRWVWHGTRRMYVFFRQTTLIAQHAQHTEERNSQGCP